jgi:hypothetical protein
MTHNTSVTFVVLTSKIARFREDSLELVLVLERCRWVCIALQSTCNGGRTDYKDDVDSAAGLSSAEWLRPAV